MVKAKRLTVKELNRIKIAYHMGEDGYIKNMDIENLVNEVESLNEQLERAKSLLPEKYHKYMGIIEDEAIVLLERVEELEEERKWLASPAEFKTLSEQNKALREENKGPTKQ